MVKLDERPAFRSVRDYALAGRVRADYGARALGALMWFFSTGLAGVALMAVGVGIYDQQLVMFWAGLMTYFLPSLILLGSAWCIFAGAVAGALRERGFSPEKTGLYIGGGTALLFTVLPFIAGQGIMHLCLPHLILFSGAVWYGVLSPERQDSAAL